MKSFFYLTLFFAATSALAFVDPTILNAYYGKNYASKIHSKEEIFDLISKHQVVVGYSNARKILFGELHFQKDREGNFVEDVYCDKKFYFRQVTDISNMGNEVNIEHTWPQSKFSRRFDKETQKSDLHHLYPTDSLANNRRGNFIFGTVSEREDQLNMGDCEISRFGNKNGHMVFFPPAQHRGNVARSLFYFATRYQLQITSAEEAVLREWHKADPVDEAEQNRHEAVVKHQLVRNPFIDYPEIVDQISDF